MSWLTIVVQEELAFLHKQDMGFSLKPLATWTMYSPSGKTQGVCYLHWLCHRLLCQKQKSHNQCCRFCMHLKNISSWNCFLVDSSVSKSLSLCSMINNMKAIILRLFCHWLYLKAFSIKLIDLSCIIRNHTSSCVSLSFLTIKWRLPR